MKKLNVFLLMACLVIMGLNAQTASYKISGKVTEDSGLLMASVNVLEKGTQNGVLTNADGLFDIWVQSKNAKLVFRFIGFETVEVNLAGRTYVDVVMKASKVALEEVVTIGYGIQTTKAERKRHAEMGMPVYSMQVADYNHYTQPLHNTEGYSTIHENGFREVLREPLSTFSVDVDRASYANVRRYLNNGQLPPVDAVRIEEMLNYFSYDYAQPQNGHPFSVITSMAQCPWNANNVLLRVGIKGKEIAKENLPPSNIVFLIDVSGSMNMPNKLPLLKSSFKLLVNELRAIDRVAIVVYAGAAGVVLPSTPGNQKATINYALDRLQAGGSTAGGEGLKLAYRIAEQNFINGGNNRIVLATDGDFNVGVSSNAEMERLVEVEREKGVAITVLGFGMGNYKDDKMEIIANKGNGNYAYIDNMQEAQKMLVREFGGTLFTIAKDVKLQLEFNPAKVAQYRLIGYENRVLANEDFNNDKKDAGDIGAGHTVTALYEIVPMGSPKDKTFNTSIDPLKYQQTKILKNALDANEWLTLKLRYKAPAGHESKLMVHTVVGEVPAFEDGAADLRFAAGVAAFGMLLRESEYKGNLTYTQVADMVKNARGKDATGDKGELLKLINLAGSLQKGQWNQEMVRFDE